jgi:hypothetical protein
MSTLARWLAACGLVVCGVVNAAAQPPTPTVFVDCRVESLQDAVDLAPASALITLSGTCTPVTLRRNVTLSGDGTASIVVRPVDVANAVTVPAGVRATLLNLTLIGGIYAGIQVINSEVGLRNVRVERSRFGVHVSGYTARVTADSVSVTRNRIGVDNLGGSLTFRRSTIDYNGHNSVDDVCNSGGLTMLEGSLTLEDSSIANNRVGGLCLEAAVTLIVRSSITRNAGAAGGIVIYGPGTTSISQSSITRNHNPRDGGGIGVHQRHDGLTRLTITNSTLAFNTSAGTGGGLFVTPYVEEVDPVILLHHATVVGNQAGGGAGIWAGTPVSLRGSLLSGNRLAAGGESDCGGPATFNSQGWNLVTAPATCTLASGFGDLIGARPLLGTTATWGVTEFIPLLKTSLGLDVIPLAGPLGGLRCTTAVKADQRGVTRPVGARCDMGSVEQ